MMGTLANRAIALCEAGFIPAFCQFVAPSLAAGTPARHNGLSLSLLP